MPEVPPDAMQALSADQPADTTILEANVPDAQSGLIALPASGKLWVFYECGGTGQAQLWLWHQGGAETLIPPDKETVLESREGDALIYQLATPSEPLKLGWAYV